MTALGTWAVYLRDRSCVLKTDHEPVKYLQSKIKLTGRQMRWIDELQSYNFIAEHLPGSKNSAADALNRNVESSIILNSLRLKDSSLAQRIQEGYADDKWLKDFMACFWMGTHNTPRKSRCMHGTTQWRITISTGQERIPEYSIYHR